MAEKDSRSTRASNPDHEAAMAERRGRRLSVSCRLFFLEKMTSKERQRSSIFPRTAVRRRPLFRCASA